MIKLIASDLDGTLIRHGRQGIDDSTFEIIGELQNRGVLFCAASGRQYPNMKRMFRSVWEKMLFVAENGGIAMYRDKPVHKSVIPFDLMIKLSREILSAPGCELLLSGRQSSYMIPKTKEYADLLLHIVKNTMTVLDAPECVNEDIVKMSIYMYEGELSEVQKRFAHWSEYFNVAVSGKQWLDFGLSTKGSVLRMVQDTLGLKRDEIMAFGDNFNDEHMLSLAGHSYAMLHASEDVRRMSSYHCANVDDVLLELLENQTEYVLVKHLERL